MPQGHPYVRSPVLHVLGIVGAVPDTEIMRVLGHHEVLKARADIHRDPSNLDAPAVGTISFQDVVKAEKALAICQNHPIPNYNCAISLSAASPTDATGDALPVARPRLIKHLPDGSTRSYVYDLFRPFGAIHRIVLQNDGPSFSGLGIVEYFAEEDAIQATTEMHCTDVKGSTITIQVYQASKGPFRNLPGPFQPAPKPVAAAAAPNSAALAAPFVPRSSTTSGSIWAAPSSNPTSPDTSRTSPKSVTSAGETTNGDSAAPIDPRNLFCKCIGGLTSQDLFVAFKRFGKIVSARAMKDQEGNPRGFGFVSFEREEDCAAALKAMNGTAIRSQGTGEERVLSIRYHEPKRLREGRQHSSGSGEGDLSSSMSRHLDGLVLDPIHTTTPMLRQTSSSSSSSSSLAYSNLDASTTTLSEYDRLLLGVSKLESNVVRARQLTDLLVALPKADRALCLFNASILTAKVGEASHVLTALDGESPASHVPATISTPSRRGTAPYPLTPEQTPERATPPETLAGLAKLSSNEIVQRIERGDAQGVMRPSEDARRDIEVFVDTLAGKQPHEQKQKLGERLFKVLKAQGVKAAPKRTIALLDSETDLRALAHLINVPDVLKLKAMSHEV